MINIRDALDFLERAKSSAENIERYAYDCDFGEARLVILELIAEVERLRSHHIQIMGKIRAWILNDCAEVCRGFDWRDDEITRLRNESDAWKAKAIEERFQLLCCSEYEPPRTEASLRAQAARELEEEMQCKREE